MAGAAKCSVGVVIVAVLVSACGFHLRGAGIDSSIETAEVREVGRAPVSRELARMLRGAGVTVVDEGEEASTVIEILNQREGRRGVSVTDRTKTAEYELSLEVLFRALDAKGAELVPARVARVERVYRLDATNIVGSHEQETLVRSEMEREIVRQIVTVLEAAVRSRKAANAGQTG